MIPRQVHDEVWRNRDNKLFDCMKEFNQIKFNLPVFCKNYTEYPEFDKKLSDLNKLISAWKNKIEGDINELTLPADVVIRSFFYRRKFNSMYGICCRSASKIYAR